MLDKRINKKNLKQVLDLRLEGKTFREIASTLKIDLRQVYRYTKYFKEKVI